MRILLADDHPLFRDGITSLVEAWGHAVIGTASDGPSAVAEAARLRPDLILMDVTMPGGGGVEATRQIAAAQPEIPIVMLTASEGEDDLFAAIKAGARGYLLKNLEARELRTMLEAVGRGEAAVTPATAARILAELARPGVGAAGAGARGPRSEAGPGAGPLDGPASPDRLTDRERDVLRLVVVGLRNKEIAAQLGISENTTKYHLRNILEKLHAESRAEVAARAVREHLVGDD